MALPSFTVTGNLREILGDDEAAATRARVTFTADIYPRRMLRYGDTLYPPPAPLTAIVNDAGDVVLNEDDEPVTLLARDDALITDLRYRVSITLADPSGPISGLPGRKMKPWIFYAPDDSYTIDLGSTGIILFIYPGSSLYPSSSLYPAGRGTAVARIYPDVSRYPDTSLYPTP